MATKSSMSIQEDVIRFARFSVVASTAGTFTQISIPTQLSLERGLIWLIHFIEFEIDLNNLDDPAQDASEVYTVQITRESKTALLSYDDADVIEKLTVNHKRGATIGTDAGPMWTLTESPKMYRYDPPIPYGARNIFVAIDTSSATIMTARGRIGYTIKGVDQKSFFSVAQSLIG